MDRKTQRVFDDLNRAIIKFHGTYSEWSSRHHISYHEMLVLYTIREFGFCTQKQICSNYLLPKQTIHNVITSLRKSGILEYDETCRIGREKALALSGKGQKYAAPFLKSLETVESRALELLGTDKLLTLINLLLEYDRTLNQALEESR